MLIFNLINVRSKIVRVSKSIPIHHPDLMTPVPIRETGNTSITAVKDEKSFKIFTTSIGDYGSVELITIPVDDVSF